MVIYITWSFLILFFFLCQMLKFAWLAIKLFGFKLNENDNVTYS
jgi:hypothetical protein